jgi:hypothetical protein
MIGQMWKSLQKDAKAIFYQEAEDDKIRYLREVHFHNQSHPCAIIPKYVDIQCIYAMKTFTNCIHDIV